ncbi:hypothetical protein [Maritimibacter fusiformis]|uniref:Sulfotransferase family protein n=1 Tax=Maritimibacter fusiformis TaxID=2603819 RepID=A0A5D0RNG8_9RHOB|nr:hypothetical protein [Maritimibacter fusiformis]TYB82506.1 hypothetical protein FVF75_07265 [Maritimibacter fusiformis]
MHISYHIGAHCTDEDQLIKSLLKNPDVMVNEGIAVPAPSRYRQLVSNAVNTLGGQKASPDTQDVLLEAMLDTDSAERIVLSHENFMGAPRAAVDGDVLYPKARDKTFALRNLFPDAKVEFFMAVRDPATWVPALHAKLTDTPFPHFRASIEPEAFLWSEVVRDIREANPDSPITVWCNEDTAMIWPEVMHEVAGIDPQVQLMGGFDVLARIMAREGVKRLRTYLGTHPPANEIQRRRVLAAFLDKYAIDEQIEEEIDLPGWPPELVESLTAAYEDDMLEVARIPGVTLLTA